MEEEIKTITIELSKDIVYVKENNGDVTPIWIKDFDTKERNILQNFVTIVKNQKDNK